MDNYVEHAEKPFMKKRTKKLIFCLALIILPLIQFVIFYVGVNFNSIKIAFFSYSGFDDEVGHFVAFEHFKEVFEEITTSGNWKPMIRNSVLIWGLGLVIKFPLSIVISYFIYKNAKIGRAFKVILFAPSIISTMVLIMLYKYFVDEAFPELLKILFNVTVKGGFINNPNYRFISLYMYGFIMGFGVGLLLYTNAMDSISESIVESAHLDGVGYMQEFWYITLPMIFPTIKTMMVIGSASILTEQFNLYEFYGRKAVTDIQTVGYYIFKETMMVGKEGYPRLSAMGIIITCVAVPFTLLVRAILNRIDPMEMRDAKA